MEKQWIDSEDGRLALEELAAYPEVLNIINSIGSKHLQASHQNLLGININDPKADRLMLIARAEIDGGIKMLKYIKDLLVNPRQKNSK